jgi:hypothetical protein
MKDAATWGKQPRRSDMADMGPHRSFASRVRIGTVTLEEAAASFSRIFRDTKQHLDPHGFLKT